VVARDRRTAPLGATSPPQAKAGSAWNAKRPRANKLAKRGIINRLCSFVKVGSSFFNSSLSGYCHYDATRFEKVPPYACKYPIMLSTATKLAKNTDNHLTQPKQQILSKMPVRVCFVHGAVTFHTAKPTANHTVTRCCKSEIVSSHILGYSLLAQLSLCYTARENEKDGAKTYHQIQSSKALPRWKMIIKQGFS
jgi:hypothetical protein